MSSNLIYFNGTFYHENEVPELAMDRGLFFGDGIFESFRSLRGKIIGFNDHLARLYEGLRVIKIDTPWTQEQMHELILKTIQESGLEDCYLRVNITRGKWMGSIPPILSSRPNLIILCRKFMPFREELYERGYRTITLTSRRNETSPLCHIKSLNYLESILARVEALEKDVDEGIFLNTQGNLAEAAVSNLFLIQKGCLLTPPFEDGILPGVTRKFVLDSAKKLDFKVHLRSIKPEELKSCEEAFLSNSLMGILPWVENDGMKIGSGKPGPITEKIRMFYQNNVS